MDQSNGFSPPEALLFQGNINENWKRWKQQLDLYLVATEKEKKIRQNQIKYTPYMHWK